jgi:hypothetical protein
VRTVTGGPTPDRPDGALPPAVQAADRKIVLRGPPRRITGTLELAAAPPPAPVGAGGEVSVKDRLNYRMALTRAVLIGTSLPGVPPAARLSFRTVLQPGMTGCVPVIFTVPDLTPPGTYEAVFDVGGQAVPAEVEVLPYEHLAVRDGDTVLTGAPGETIRLDLVFINRGNIPVALDSLGDVGFDDLEPLCPTLNRSLARVRAHGSRKDAFSVFADDLIAQLANQAVGAGTARVAGGPVTLPPGACASVAVEVHLPARLNPGRRYRGRVGAGASGAWIRVDARQPARPPDRPPRKSSARSAQERPK